MRRHASGRCRGREHVELRRQGREFAHGERPLEGDEVGLGVRADLLHEGLFRRTGDEEDLRAEFILQAIADQRKPLGRPDAERGAAAGVDQHLLAAARREFPGGLQVCGARHQSRFVRRRGHPQRSEQLQVVSVMWCES
jgi:hypothetical protein